MPGIFATRHIHWLPPTHETQNCSMIEEIINASYPSMFIDPVLIIQKKQTNILASTYTLKQNRFALR